GNVTRQHDGGVEVGEGGRRRRVGQVVRGHVHGLDRGDRAGLGRGDALLQDAHFLGQGRLVTHRRRHAAQQRGHFGTGQGVAVDVVHEQQDVLALAGLVLLVDRKSTRLNSSHVKISYAVFCLKKKKKTNQSKDTHQ